MDKHFKFLTLPKASGTVANIFIHGYSAGHDLEDRRTLASSVPASLQNCVNVFAFWPSSHFTRVDTVSRNLLGAATRIHPLFGGAALAADRAVHFARIRARAEEMGKSLLEQLNEYLFERHRSVTTVNLIGHSLGGRLVVSALKNLAHAPVEGLVIDQVLLMAAAVNVDPEDARQMRQRIKGRMINAYSRDDWTLYMNVGETSLGRNEVEHFDNVQISGFGHGDYWKQLPVVMARTEFKGFQAQQVGMVMGTAGRGDPVITDSMLYRVLHKSPWSLTEEAIKHLKSSSWTSIKDDEKDRVYSFARELQLVAGHCVVNAARRRGLAYIQVLDMLAGHFELGSKLHHCANVLEVEALLLEVFFRHAFPDGHPLAQAPLSSARAMPAKVYFKHIDALAERITVGSYFKSPTLNVETSNPGTGAVLSSGQISGLISATTVLGSLNIFAKRSVSRVVTNVKTALKPGYSALIPAVAIVFYARLTLDDEALM